MAITKVINDAVDLNQTTDYSGLRLPVGTTGNVVESFTTDYLVVGGGGSGSLQGAGGAGGLRTSYNNSTTTTNTLSFPSGKTAIATYMLDNNATDLSENYNGAETNITYNTGQYGGAAVFNGSSSEITASSFASLSQVGISMWVNMPNISQQAGLIARYGSTREFAIYMYGGTLIASIYYNGNNGNATIVTASTYMSNNTWHHIAYTANGSTAPKLYIDGSEVGTPQYTDAARCAYYTSSEPLDIGHFAGVAAYNYEGLIDQVRIYDAALSSTDVTNIYNNEVQANSGGGTAAESSLTLSAGTAYDVTVGAGGIDTYTSGGSSGSGANSIFSTITSTGGGGAGATSSGAGAASGKNGGSGGGAGANAGGSPGSGTLGQGYIGGTALSYFGSYAGGGGGGALGAGGNTTSNTVAGNGGAQLNLAITGNSVGYAGGGGGSLYGTGTVGTNDSSAGAAAPSGSSSANGESAPFNLGGGGGGSNHITGITNITGGAGGSGVVILRYPTASVSSFTTTGTLNTPSTTDTIADTAYPVANNAYYKLDNSAIDLSGSTGKFDQGGVFNGSSSYISTGIPIDSYSSRSYSFWFKQNSNTGNSRIFGGVDGSATNGGMLRVRENNGDINYYSINNTTFTFTTTLTNDVWTHIALTDDGTTAKLYVNGSEITNPSTASYTTVTNTNLQIGRGMLNTGSIGNYTNGSIDQVRIYDVALSSIDVTALSNETVSTTGQLNFPSGQTAIATYELNGNANGILTTTDLSTVNYPAGAGCIALYEMNGTADDTSGVYNGTPSNIDYNFGAFGQAAVFNGSSSRIVTGVTPATGSGQFSVSGWVNVDSLSVISGVFSTITNSGTDRKGFSVHILTSGIVRVLVYDSAGVDIIESTDLITVGNWYHIAITYNNGLTKLYVDGNVQTDTVNQLITGYHDSINIGRYYASLTSNAMLGKIDQVRIFNTALTQSQITTLARGIGTSYSGVDTNVSYAYNGTPTNVTYENGRFNKAAIFNGSSSRITLPIGSPFNDSNTIKAISAWIKAGTSTSRVYPLSISSTSNANDYWYIGYMGDLNAIYVATRDGSSSNQSIAYATITPDTGWHHIVVQLTATGKEIYLDGISQTITNSNSGTATNTSWINYPSYSGTVQGAIGVLRLASISYGKGSIDQIRIFETALSDTQVTQLYNEHYQTKFTDGSDTAIVFTQGTGTVTFSGVDPAPPQGALRANTSYSEDGSGSVIEHYNGTDWKYFDAIKYCTTNTLNFPSGAGCIASYNFNNNVNDIGNTYNGVNSNVTFNASGKFGAAAVFNGSNARIDISGVLTGFTNVYSFSIWAKIPNTDNFSFIRSNTNTTNQTNLIGFALHQNGNYYFDYGNVTTGRLTGSAPTAWRNGNWHNFVFVSSSTQKLVYVDGVLFDSKSSTASVSSLNTVTLGYYGSNYANGSMDQLRIFNDSLTSDEVAQLYNNEIACS